MGGGPPHTGWRLAGLASAWLVGVGLQLHERSLLPLQAYAALLAGGLLGLAAAAWTPRPVLLAGLALAAAGFGATGTRAALLLQAGLASELEGVDLVLTGVVAALPQRGASGLRFRFDIEEARRGGEPVEVPSRVALGWYGGFHDDGALTPMQQSLRAGQRWRFGVRLRQPHGTLNPHGFDQELQLFEQGVRATGYVREAPAQLLDEAAGRPIERLRQRMRDAIEAQVGDRRAAGVLTALSIGDQGAIEREDWDLFRHTGVAHLVSISGLHITMFAWGAALLVGAGWRRVAALALRVPAQSAGRWGGLAAAAGYAVFSGWGVPSQRTVWMLAAVTLLQAGGRRWPWPLVLAAAAVVVTALDPWALLQPGFWLSFAAVGMLMASGLAHEAPPVAPAADRWRGRVAAASRHLRAALRSQVVATLGLTPLTLVFFQQVSAIGFVANLIAIPVVTLLVTPLALLGALFAPLWVLGAWVVRALCTALAGLSGLPFALWSVPAAPAWAQAAGLAGALLLILPLPWRLRLLALPLSLPLLMPVLPRPETGRFEVMAVDVGQGTAVIVRTRGHVLLVDAGPRYSRDSDAGQRVLLPLLRSRGDWPLDLLVLSHRDTDHVGGAAALLQAGAVAAMSGSLEDAHPLRALAAGSRRCEAGQAWHWDGVHFQVLHPPASAYGSNIKPNGMSCVLRVAGPQGSVLLPGDIERAQEAALVVADPGALRSDVLIVPHHGSKTSSSAAFLDAVQPRLAIVQAGYRNRFGHPAREVVDRYRARGIVVRTSPSCGAWQWPGDGQGQGMCQRDVARRYWHHVPQRPPD